MNKKLFKFAYLRNGIFFLLFLSLVAGSMNYFNFGTFCSYCAVGVLQIATASKIITLEMIIILAITIVIVLIFGRIFCAWGCPSVVVRKVFPKTAASSKQVVKKDSFKNKLISNGGYIVLATAVIVSFFVGFPVFCLICPIGLFFGFCFAVFNLFVYYDPGWNLLIFPVIIILELVLFKKWCGLICPVNAIFNLITRVFGKRLTIRADKNSCTHLTKGGCQICFHNCDENINVSQNTKKDDVNCTLCLHCRDNCPSNAIKFNINQKI